MPKTQAEPKPLNKQNKNPHATIKEIKPTSKQTETNK